MITLRPTKTHRIALGLIACALIIVAGGFLLRSSAERRVTAFLTGHGIGEALVFSNGAFGGSSVVLGNIKLDPDGDSTIGDIRATIRWPFLWSSRPFSRVIIDHLVLAGTVDDGGHVSVSGIKPGPLAPLVESDAVLLNSGRLDLTTPAGDLQFSLKGAATRQPDGSFKADAAFWGSQYQVTLDTRWQGAMRADGEWTEAADIREMKGNISHVIWSRANGWMKFDGDRTGILKVSSQVQAGQIRLGNKTSLANVTLTLDGPLTYWHTILKGDVSAWPGMTAFVETQNTAGRTMLHADVGARSAEDTIVFLSNLQADMHTALPHSTLLTPLLLTTGNLNRLATAVQIMKNALTVDLIIEGEVDNLDGRIVAHGMPGKPDITVALRPAHL